jgi:hypothetical protein
MKTFPVTLSKLSNRLNGLETYYDMQTEDIYT